MYVYFGNPSHLYNQPSLTITCKNVFILLLLYFSNDLFNKIYNTILKFKYCNAGWTLSTGDVNQDNHDDLLIGSPYAATCGDQCGFVSVLLSDKKSIIFFFSKWFYLM